MIRVNEIKVSFAATVNLGNYENIKPEYAVSVICDIPLKDLDEAFDTVAEKVRSKIQAEIKEIRSS